MRSGGEISHPCLVTTSGALFVYHEGHVEYLDFFPHATPGINDVVSSLFRVVSEEAS